MFHIYMKHNAEVITHTRMHMYLCMIIYKQINSMNFRESKVVCIERVEEKKGKVEKDANFFN